MLPTLLKNSFKYTKYYNDFNNSVYDCSGVDLCRNGRAICQSTAIDITSSNGQFGINVPFQNSNNVLYLYTFYASNCWDVEDSVFINDDQYHIVNLNGKIESSTFFEKFSGYIQYLSTVWQIIVSASSIVDVSCYVFKPV